MVKTKTIIFWFCIFLLQACVISGTSKSQEIPASPDKVLFVGNSFTYYNTSLHKHLGGLLRARGLYQSGKSRLRALLISGSALDEHRAGISGMVTPGSFDVVLMQDHSVGPINPESYKVFKAAVLDMSQLIRSRGAEPILWMTWPYADRPEMTDQLFDAYAAVAQEADIRMIPVGLAFERVNISYPEINLYSKDILRFSESGQVQYKTAVKHPSLAGSYLSACVFYAFLYDQSPLGSFYTAGLDDLTASTLQSVAWDLYQAADTQAFGSSEVSMK